MDFLSTRKTYRQRRFLSIIPKRFDGRLEGHAPSCPIIQAPTRLRQFASPIRSPRRHGLVLWRARAFGAAGGAAASGITKQKTAGPLGPPRPGLLASLCA